MPEDTSDSMPGKEKDAALAGGEVKQRGRKRRKVSYLTANKIDFVDYKDVAVLRRFLNDRGKVLSGRQTGNTARQQRMIARAIRRARELALLPYVVNELTGERSGPPHRGSRHSHRASQEPSGAPQAEPAAPEAEAKPVDKEPVAEAKAEEAPKPESRADESAAEPQAQPEPKKEAAAEES